MKYRYTFDDVQAAAQHNWQHILGSIGIAPASLKNQHQPCPLCGGKDRFRFDNKGGNGTYFCNQCGAGNGFTFVQKHLNLNKFGNAVAVVAQILGMGETGNATPHITPPKRETPPPTPPKDELAKLLNVWNAATPHYWHTSRTLPCGAWHWRNPKQREFALPQPFSLLAQRQMFGRIHSLAWLNARHARRNKAIPNCGTQGKPYAWQAYPATQAKAIRHTTQSTTLPQQPNLATI